VELGLVQARLKDIESLAHDDERAHIIEDDLYSEVLRYHANKGCEISKEALKSKRIQFARWCA
jgi:hypothetical protein